MIFDEMEFGVCVRSRDGGIRYQNPYCLGVCGEHEKNRCRDHSLSRVCNASLQAEGREGITTELAEESPKRGAFDVTAVNDGSQVTLLFYPLSRRLAREENALVGHGLTPRELSIAGHLLRRRTNRHIADELGITENTLKTHLKSLYRKLPAEIRARLMDIRPAAR